MNNHCVANSSLGAELWVLNRTAHPLAFPESGDEARQLNWERRSSPALPSSLVIVS